VALQPTLDGFPAGDGSGNGWEKALDPTGNLMAEFYLEDNSTIPAGGFVSIGRAYNTAVNVQDVIVEFTGANGAVTTKPAIYGAILSNGNFDETGPVNAADLAAWRGGFGTPAGATHAQGDGNGDGDVDGADFLTWQQDFGAAASVAAGAVVPEPSVALLTTACALAFWNRGSSRPRTGGRRRALGRLVP
jgi:hypothetical protein